MKEAVAEGRKKARENYEKKGTEVINIEGGERSSVVLFVYDRLGRSLGELQGKENLMSRLLISYRSDIFLILIGTKSIQREGNGVHSTYCQLGKA